MNSLASGERLAEAALLHVAGRFGQLHAEGTLAALAADFLDVLHSGLVTILVDRLQVRKTVSYEEGPGSPPCGRLRFLMVVGCAGKHLD